jgi:hypothetical protein
MNRHVFQINSEAVGEENRWLSIGRISRVLPPFGTQEAQSTQFRI